MNFNDLKYLYNEMKKRYGSDAYKHVSELLSEAKEIHRRDWLLQHPSGDHEQSWRAFKGKNLEKLIEYIIKDEVEKLGLRVINGNVLERSNKLPEDLSRVKRDLLVDYGEFGSHLPDVDLVIFNPKNFKILIVATIKVTLRERIAQSAYWKLKLLDDPVTRNIKVWFITPDEDKTLTKREPAKKGRAIVEKDLDGSYVLTDEAIEESDKVKLFEHFIEDLRNLLLNNNS